MQRPPQQAPTTSPAPDRTGGVDRPVSKNLAALARLLARQAARETLTSPPLENGEPTDGKA